MTLIEIQMDRLVGPTHHFGGLGVGNVASRDHAGQVSNPAAAAIQGLEKMQCVAELSVPQFVLPPHVRPDFAFLRSMGFSGDDASVLARAHDESPWIFSAAMSSSAMWTANAATVTRSSGGQGTRGRTTITVANLYASLHRAIEPSQTVDDLGALFGDTVEILPPLCGGAAMRDEGAANQMRLLGDSMDSDSTERAIDVFVFGDQPPMPNAFWPRQTQASFDAIARRHGLSPSDVCFVKQHPRAIDAGAFHNDVVAMSHRNLLIHHERAFANSTFSMQAIEAKFAQRTASVLNRIEVSESTLSLDDAISTYLFNSQIVSPGNADGPPVILCPVQVQRHPVAKSLVDEWLASGVFSQVVYVDLGQSMAGGGGPACLRLRVPVDESELAWINQRARWTPRLHQSIQQIIRDGYPTSVTLIDLASIDFIRHIGRVRDQIAVQLGREIRS
ncbi:N-succinylarginine dihydrolase [Rubripirellula tenax]|uniref:N-succinylarginine dihydrolase n=1 Tax=Rubripirellula tenax TaxID=2528015 RepID=A0A5C6F4C7_9BACT|nr:N-succinylarginine dihydrolase [Rubripirellula tenax]TWU54659.1 N-succinylarginine dihydrolase [Rubripirellula tenax]